MGLRRGLPLLLCVVLLSGCAGQVAPTQGQRADVAHFVQQQLDDAWSGDPRHNRPSTVSARFLLPNGWGFAMKQCMIESGFTAFDFDRVSGFTNGLERTSDAGEEGLAWYYCRSRFPTYDTVFSDLDDAQLDELYLYYRERLVPCLALQGSAVLKVPTREQFGTGGAGQPGSWNPYLTAELPASVAVASAVLEACQPYPPGWAESVVAGR